MLATKERVREKNGSAAECVVVTSFRTELGWMAAEFCDGKLARLTFGHANRSQALAALNVRATTGEIDAQIERTIARLTDFASGNADELLEIDVVYAPGSTAFQRRVLDACRAIPAGETLSYAQLAIIAGAPGAARAVGNVMRTNRLPLVVPCHRVVASGGALGGYSAPEGLAMKRRLLAREGVAVR